MIGLGNSIAYPPTPSGISIPLDFDGLDVFFVFAEVSGTAGSAPTLPIENLGAADDTYNITGLNVGPLVSDTAMNKRSIEFDGTNDRLVLDSFFRTTGKPMTLFAAFITDQGTADCLFSKSQLDGTSQFRMDSTSQFTFRAAGSPAAGTITNNTNNGTVSYEFTTDVLEVVVVRRDSDGTWYIYNKDGKLIGLQDSAAAQSGAYFDWGICGDIGSNDFRGPMGEVGLYDKDIGADKAAELAKYLYGAWS